MKHKLATMTVLVAAVLGAGCATKKYVAQTTDPVKAKVDQVAAQANKQGATLDQTVKDVEQNQKDISATREIATTADTRAGTALQKADAAAQKADQSSHAVDELRGRITNLDDYKPAAEAVVLFGFDQDKLTKEAKADLDKLAAGLSSYKRYFIAVEGFTDQIGPADYNFGLSRRRADRVVQYLVVEHSVPVYRIQLVGLGKEKLVDTANTSAARAKNRRVVVTIYSADQAAASAQTSQ